MIKKDPAVAVVDHEKRIDKLEKQVKQLLMMITALDKENKRLKGAVLRATEHASMVDRRVSSITRKA